MGNSFGRATGARLVSWNLLVLVLVLVGLWTGKLIGFWRPYPCHSCDRRRSWNHWPSPHSRLSLEDDSTRWPHAGWRNIFSCLVSVFPWWASSRALLNHCDSVLVGKTVCCRSALFQLITCTPLSCHLFLFCPSETWFPTFAVWLDKCISWV